MKVLSLFDGIATARYILDKLGIPIDAYYASEVDKYAIMIANKNFPDIKQIGDIQLVDGTELGEIDLLVAGSPCQGFSFAGKQLNFNDPRSRLFFEFLRIKEECKPKYWMLENVVMKKEYQAIISEYLGCEPIRFDAGLVSAQRRKRLYWTNIPNVEMPTTDNGMVVGDILEDGYDSTGIRRGRYKENEVKKLNILTAVARNNSTCNLAGMAEDISGHDFLKRIYHIDAKCPTLTTCGGGNITRKIALENNEYRELTVTEYERLQGLPDGYTALIMPNGRAMSKTQRRNALGNGWQADAVALILKQVYSTLKGLNNESIITI